jgi:hypothetical protein
MLQFRATRRYPMNIDAEQLGDAMIDQLADLFDKESNKKGLAMRSKVAR